MTRNQFLALCLSYGIAPCIALENENVRAALAARDAKAVEFALANEFLPLTPPNMENAELSLSELVALLGGRLSR